MFAVVLMAIFAHDAIGKSSVGFALSFAFFQFVMMILWWRTGVHDADHRPLSIPYVFGFLATTLLFIVSVFVDESLRYTLWAIALGLSLLLPASSFLMKNINEVAREQVNLVSRASASLIERLGLFTIIVLGEVVIGIVNGASHLPLEWSLVLVVFLGTFIAVGVWFNYFDFISHRKPKDGLNNYFFWFYMHLPLVIGIVGLGAGTVNLIENVHDPLTLELRWLFFGSLALILLSISFIAKSIQQGPDHIRVAKTGKVLMFNCAFLALVGGLIQMNAILTLFTAVVLLLTPTIGGFLVWVKNK
jgi:low temperature requirement protein LtrA